MESEKSDDFNQSNGLNNSGRGPGSKFESRPVAYETRFECTHSIYRNRISLYL